MLRIKYISHTVPHSCATRTSFLHVGVHPTHSCAALSPLMAAVQTVLHDKSNPVGRGVDAVDAMT